MSLTTLKTKVEQLIEKAQNGSVDDRFQKMVTDNLEELNDDTITTLAECAFYQRTKLKRVNLPNLQGWQACKNAFKYCSNLEEFKADKLVNIAETMFGSCTKLIDFDFSNIIKLENYSFNTSGIEKAILTKCTYLGTGAFNNCKSLHTVYLPIGCKSINATVFSGCTALEFVEVEKGFKDSLYIHTSTLYSAETLHAIIENLADMSTAGTKPTFQIGTTNIAKLDEEHKAMLAAKGWLYQ